MGLLNYGVNDLMDLTGHIAEGVIEIVFYGIIGAVIALASKATIKSN